MGGAGLTVAGALAALADGARHPVTVASILVAVSSCSADRACSNWFALG